MNILKTTKSFGFTIFLIPLLFVFPYPEVLKGAEVPSAKDVVYNGAKLPTIADLTGGKVKEGDLIDKNNMDLVEEYLSEGNKEALRQGLVMRMADHKLEAYGGVPYVYKEATDRNRGKAVFDEDGTVTVWYEKQGVPWPGGYPFPTPETAKEVMANHKYGNVMDDFALAGWMLFINKEGKHYKSLRMEAYYVWVSTRSTEPHTWPGYECQIYRKISFVTTPRSLKGFGSYGIRYYNDDKKYDTGHLYIPSLKRMLRVSPTTWQEYVAGTDFTYGDATGFQEPLSTWDFKFIGTKYFLHHEFKSDFPLVDEKTLRFSPKVEFDAGQRWPRLGYSIIPFHVIEAKPKIKHMYSKKLIYVYTEPYCKPDSMIPLFDAYDQQGNIWKWYTQINGDYIEEGHYAIPTGVIMTDLQSRHTTLYSMKEKINVDFKPSKIGVKFLLSAGK